jgi:hypothetical protein
MTSRPHPAASPVASTSVSLRSVRALLLGLVLTCLTPGLVGVGMLIHRAYQDGRTQIESDTIRTARAMVQAVDAQLGKAATLALALSTSSFITASEDLAGFHRRARDLIRTEGIGVDAVLSDASGQQVVNTSLPFGAALPRHGSAQQVRRVFESGETVLTDVFLGAAADDGRVEYGYADAVRLAGHSCPTVASAWLMTRAALVSLYGDVVPERGGVRVELRGALNDGVNGVVASVVGLITGAAGDAGFKGIGGRFVRRGLLSDGADIAGQLRFTRLDSGASVTVSAHLERVPSDARVALLLPRCLSGTASPDEQALFRSLWQDRVRRLFADHADDPAVIALQR